MADNLLAFKWHGINNRGQRVDGVIQANSMQDAQAELNKKGVEVISIQPKKQTSLSSMKFFSQAKKVKTEEVLLFTRFLATMLASGLPIVQALDIIAHDQENLTMKNLILGIKSNVESGKTLAESFNQYPQQFGNLYCSLIKAGEKSGTLDKILIRLANYLERADKLRRKVKKALVYPAAILTVALIVSLVLLIFVVPQFENMFKSFGAQLPLFTRMVVSLSKFVRSYWWLLAIIIGGIIWWVKNYFRQNPSAQEYLDRKMLNVYIIGSILRNSIIARYTRTMAITLEAGMPIVDSMKSMAPVMGNKIYGDAILRIADEVANGYQLSASMRTSQLFPNMALQMIAVGETSGALTAMLNKVADYYEEEVNTTVDNLSTLLEPLIMLVLGVVVGGFVVAMYLPIFKIGSLF